MPLTVNTDTIIPADLIEPTNAQAIIYGAANVTVTIAPGIFVASPQSVAVDSNQDGSTLINNGTITGFSGVFFDGNDATIINNAGRTIAGNNDGISIFGDGATITNHGVVAGYRDAGVRVSAGASAVVLTNDGEIYGRDQGVAAFGGQTIDNSGLIRSDDTAVQISSTPALTTVIHNAAGGTIKGTDDAITTSGAARLVLDNRGTIAGDIDLNATMGNVNDVVTNRGKITGDVLLGPGNDSFKGAAGKSAVEVFGEDGNDALTGGKSGDRLDGGAGNDTVRGGRGKDNLFGGTDNDVFDFNAIKETVTGAKRDVIQDFQHGPDHIDLKGIDAKTGVSGNQNFKFIGKSDFHDKKGELRYEDKGAKVIVQGDVNGDGKADFEILVKIGALFAGDFLL